MDLLIERRESPAEGAWMDRAGFDAGLVGGIVHGWRFITWNTEVTVVCGFREFCFAVFLNSIYCLL